MIYGYPNSILMANNSNFQIQFQHQPGTGVLYRTYILFTSSRLIQPRMYYVTCDFYPVDILIPTPTRWFFQSG